MAFGKLSDIDDVLIQYADTLSPTQISFKIEGVLSPVQVQARINQLLDSPDWLTLAKQDQLVTMKMRQWIVKLEEMPLTTRSAEVALAGLERIGNRLDKRAEASEKDLTSLYAFQGTAFLDAVMVVWSHLRGALTQANPEAEKIFDANLEAAIRFAQIELHKHELEE